MEGPSNFELVQMILLWSTIYALSTIPLHTGNFWANLTILTFVIPVFIGKITKGGHFFGLASLDMKVLTVMSLLGFLAVLSITYMDESLKKEFENYGQTIRSTGIVYGLRMVGFIVGLLLVLPFVKREGLYANSMNNNG